MDLVDHDKHKTQKYCRSTMILIMREVMMILMIHLMIILTLVMRIEIQEITWTNLTLEELQLDTGRRCIMKRKFSLETFLKSFSICVSHTP